MSRCKSKNENKCVKKRNVDNRFPAKGKGILENAPGLIN
jgi:hypothetical protein